MSEFFRKMRTCLGYLLGVPLVAIILLAFLPLIVLVVTIFGTIELHTKLWMWLRHDPKCELEIKDLEDTNWGEAETKDDFVSIFKLVSDTIAKLSHAKQGDIAYDGFSVFDAPDQIKEWAQLNMSQTLRTEYAEIRLTFDFGTFYCEGQKKVIVGPENGDDECDNLPPITAEVVKPDAHIERNFMINSIYEIWAVVCLLRGDAKFTTITGQLWAYISEHNVWLTQYKADNSDYGLRSEFKDQTAHKYGYDK